MVNVLTLIYLFCLLNISELYVFVPCIVIQLCDVNQQTAFFKLLFLIECNLI